MSLSAVDWRVVAAASTQIVAESLEAMEQQHQWADWGRYPSEGMYTLERALGVWPPRLVVWREDRDALLPFRCAGAVPALYGLRGFASHRLPLAWLVASYVSIWPGVAGRRRGELPLPSVPQPAVWQLSDRFPEHLWMATWDDPWPWEEQVTAVADLLRQAGAADATLVQVTRRMAPETPEWWPWDPTAVIRPITGSAVAWVNAPGASGIVSAPDPAMLAIPVVGWLWGLPDVLATILDTSPPAESGWEWTVLTGP